MWMRVRCTNLPPRACLDGALAKARRQGDAAAERERLLVLRDLVALRQVGIEVILAREDRTLLHVAAERDRRGHREIDRPAIEHRQRAGQADAHRARMRVRRRAKCSGTAAENFGGREQLGVDFQPDDGFESDLTPDNSIGCQPFSTQDDRARCGHFRIGVGEVGPEVLDEHPGELRRLRVVGGLVAPGAARIEDFRRHTRTRSSARRC